MKKSELIALLLKIGISKENAEKIASGTSEESTETIDTEELFQEWKTNQISLMKNEPSLVEEVRSAEMAKQRSIFEQKIKQIFALTGEEIKDKKLEEIISLAKEKATSKTDKTSAELQEQILQLTNENKRLIEEEIPKVKNEVTTYKKKFDIEQILMKKIPSDAEKLRIPFETASKLAIGDLHDSYDVDIDEKGSIVLLEKGKDLKAKSKDGTKFLSVDDVIAERLEAHKAIVKSNGAPAGQPGANVVVVEPVQGQVKTNAMSKAEAHAAKIKEQSKSRGRAPIDEDFE
jgi:hypothetical protein